MVSVDNLSATGVELGGFFQGMQSGLIAFIIGLGIAGGIVAIIYAVVHVVKKSITGSHK